MNRRERRAARVRPAQAKAAAVILAAACFDRTPDGRQRRIEHPAAVKALTRAFTRSIADAGRAQLLRLTLDEGAAFPSCAEEHRQPVWAHWIAVTFDPSGRGVFATLATRPDPGTPEAVHRAAAWERIRVRLREAVQDAWAPVWTGASS